MNEICMALSNQMNKINSIEQHKNLEIQIEIVTLGGNSIAKFQYQKSKWNITHGKFSWIFFCFKLN